MASDLCPRAADALEAASYHVPAYQLRHWEPVSFRDSEQRDALQGWLSWLEGALECAKRSAPHEVQHLEAAFDAIEKQLDQIDREVRRAG